MPVFHTAAIETGFLSRQFSRRHVRLPAAADTEALGRRWLRHRDGDAPAHGISLVGWRRRLGQPAEAPHHALGDALTTAKAFVALASLLDAVAPQTVGSLVAADFSTARFRRSGAALRPGMRVVRPGPEVLSADYTVPRGSSHDPADLIGLAP